MTIIDASFYQRPPDVPERLASGGVVVRADAGRLFVALTREEDMVEYVLPKGGIEAGESYLEAAEREVEEETGLAQLELIKKLEVIERLTMDKAYWNIIHFYLFYTGQVEATPTDTAHPHGMEWFPLDQLPQFWWPEQKELIIRHRDQIIKDVNEFLSAPD